MTKNKFSQILMTRFAALSEEARYFLLFNLIKGAEEINESTGGLFKLREQIDENRIKEWGQNIQEILFPEDMEIVKGEMKC